MKNERIKIKLKKLPEGPGVYQFKRGKKILYIGKATSLKDRVRSYFNGKIEETRSPLISKMLGEFDDIQFIKTDSVLEALVLEANLIKKYQPEANIKEKDDRSFNYVVVTLEDFPRILIMRGREIEKLSFAASLKNHGNFLLKISSVRRRRSSRGFFREDSSDNFSISYIFGPFPNGSQLKAAIKIVRKMFPFRDKCMPAEEQKLKKPLAPRSFSGVGCFNYQIGLCPGVCVGKVSKKEYAETIKNIVLFFESDKKKLIKNLEKQMKNFAKNREFEKAQNIKKTIFTLNHIQDVALIKESKVSRLNLDTRIESYDIAHLSGTNMVGVMTVLENGEIKKSEYRKFSARGGSAFGGKTVLGNGRANDIAALSEVLSRRLAHLEWPLPGLLVVDGGIAQKNAMEKILADKNFQIPVVSVVKDERHKPKEILGINSSKLLDIKHKNSNLKQEILLANAEAHRFAISFHRQLRRKII